MIELPEAYVIAVQINNTLTGKVIKRVIANAHPHAFANFNLAPESYGPMLAGKAVEKSALGLNTGGCHVEITCGDMLLAINASIRFIPSGVKVSTKHQFMMEFNDSSVLSCTVQMTGMFICVPSADADNTDISARVRGPSLFDDAFNIEYFLELFQDVKPAMSVKEFLTSENRIPGLGNGVMHDILFNARIHPRCRIESLSASQKERLFHSAKSTLRYMAERGGRDTEKDLFGNYGAYKTILSSKTSGLPCRKCKSRIIKEMYLGGNTYFCPECQASAV